MSKTTTILGSLIALGGIAMVASPRRSRASSSPKKPAPLRPRIVITTNCKEWDIPDAWWRNVAQPKFEQLAPKVLDETRDGAIAVLTYALLEGETGSCALPPSLHVQVDNPAGDDYWPGEPTMLYLAQHVAQAVGAGIAAWLEDPTSTPTLAWELDPTPPAPTPAPSEE